MRRYHDNKKITMNSLKRYAYTDKIKGYLYPRTLLLTHIRERNAEDYHKMKAGCRWKITVEILPWRLNKQSVSGVDFDHWERGLAGGISHSTLTATLRSH